MSAPCRTLLRSIWSNGYGATKGAKSPAPKTMISTISPPIASRCRKKRMRAYVHWLRTFSSRPASTVESTGADATGGMLPSGT